MEYIGQINSPTIHVDIICTCKNKDYFNLCIIKIGI